jgi:hypothetical protein
MVSVGRVCRRGVPGWGLTDVIVEEVVVDLELDGLVFWAGVVVGVYDFAEEVLRASFLAHKSHVVRGVHSCNDILDSAAGGRPQFPP